MDIPGDLLLAHAGLPGDEHAGVEGAHLLGGVEYVLQLVAVYDQAILVVRGLLVHLQALGVIFLHGVGGLDLLVQGVDLRDVPGVDHDALDIPLRAEHRHAGDDDVLAVLGLVLKGDGPLLLHHQEHHRLLHPHGVDQLAHVVAHQLLLLDAGVLDIGLVHHLHVAVPVGDQKAVKAALDDLLQILPDVLLQQELRGLQILQIHQQDALRRIGRSHGRQGHPLPQQTAAAALVQVAARPLLQEGQQRINVLMQNCISGLVQQLFRVPVAEQNLSRPVGHKQAGGLGAAALLRPPLFLRAHAALLLSGGARRPRFSWFFFIYQIAGRLSISISAKRLCQLHANFCGPAFTFFRPPRRVLALSVIR